jgi:acetoin utilization deacetylase AcuC-like enzyme
MSIIFHPRFLDHQQWESHPESPLRLVRAVDKMMELWVWNNVVFPEPATKDDILLVHTDRLVSSVANSRECYLDPDTFVHEDTYEIALLAAGGTIEAVRRAKEEGTPSIALVRPPGHHAGADFLGGFCYFNNAAIAVKKLGLRAAIVDIDVHHGNGTQSIFWDDDEVLYISTHQYGIYPGTGAAEEVGEGAGEGFTVNIPLDGGAGDATFMMAFERIIKPVIEQFKPQMVIIDIGVDAHYKDPLASLTLSSPGYLELCKRLMTIPADYGATFVLEGGYHLDSTAEVIGGLAAMCQGVPARMKFYQNMDDEMCGLSNIERAVSIQKDYWEIE